jgi:hypothetical protein
MSEDKLTPDEEASIADIGQLQRDMFEALLAGASPAEVERIKEEFYKIWGRNPTEEP